jgi:crotonobetainyl-CoA:carnitine CoA-transferase CaiB-like acyl-CoA transferase
MTQALAGIRVLDLSSGPAAGMTTMMLADFGAEVISILRPASAPADELAKLAAAPMWQRGKLLLMLDLAQRDGLDEFHNLAAAADVLVCNWRSDALTRKQLDFTQMHARHPHLVYCHISGFGSHGPMANCPAYEHTVAAYSGRMRMFTGIVDRPGPVFSALQVGVHACAQAATAGILAALLAKGTNGTGRLVETSLLQGMLPYEMGAMIGMQFVDQFPDLMPVIATPGAEPPMPSLFYHPAQAQDGRWMQFGNLLPHLFDNFLIATDLIDVIADEDFNPKQLLLKTPQKQEAFRERMLKRIQSRSAQEWMETFIEDGGIVATTYQTTQQALEDPDIVANGHAIPRKCGGVQLGPLARLTATPAQPGEEAVASTDWAEQWAATPRQQPASACNEHLPLAGVRVVEIATIIAAPLGAAFLADMGAQVIKVEQVGGDPFRGMLSGLGSARVNAGKHSIAVNMKSDAGRQIVLDLLKDADVVIHNFRPGVPERLGIGYQEIIALNPNIIYLQSNGYGPDGPGALRPSTHPIPGAAMGGVMYQMGEQLPTDLQDINGLKLWCRRLMRANEVNPDPNTAVVVTTAVMLGLMARTQTGAGQQIIVDMFGANAYANSDDFLSYPGKTHRPLPDNLLHGLSATYRLYPCAEDQWVFLGLVTPREREIFRETLLQAGIPAPTSQALAANDDSLTNTLTQLFATQTADQWQVLLGTIGCVRADGPAPNEFWTSDEQVEALGLLATANHPSWGEYQRHGPLVMFDGQRQPLGAPPLAGQHNDEVLTGLGYTPAQIEELYTSGALWQES